MFPSSVEMWRGVRSLSSEIFDLAPFRSKNSQAMIEPLCMAWWRGYRPPSSGLDQFGSAPFARARHITGKLWAAAALYKSKLGLRLDMSSSWVVSSSSCVGDSSALSSSSSEGGGMAGTRDSPKTSTSSSDWLEEPSTAAFPSLSEGGREVPSFMTTPLSCEAMLKRVSEPTELTDRVSMLTGDLSAGNVTALLWRRATP